MSLTPTVPQIAPIASASGQIATSDDIGALLGPIAARANSTLPDPYTQGTQVAEPHYHEHAPAQTNRPTNTAPITGQVADVKRARRQNAVAELANTISQAGNMIQEKKNNKLKDQLTDVMKAKQVIANAKTVLANPSISDSLKQTAQGIITKQTKQLNDILSDPKTQKQMQKALDISFVDPEKNKTPEVQAYQAAMKEFKEAGPFNSDNPAEHVVSQAAANQGKGAQAQASSQQPIALQPAAPKSQTPYADKALAKDLPSIEANPQYAPALKQQQDAQKQLAAIVPKLIDAEAKAQLQAARDINSANRAGFTAQTNIYRDSQKAISGSKLQQDKDKAAMSRRAAADATSRFNTLARVNAALKIAANKSLDKAQSDKIKYDSLSMLDKQIGEKVTTLKNSETLLEQMKANNKGDKNAIELLTVQRDLIQQDLTGLQQIRASKFSDAPDSQVQGLLNDDSGTNSGTTIESVGYSDSDEPKDDSDKYGNN